MTLGVIYLFVLIPMIAVVAGIVALNSTHREAERLRAIRAERKRASA